MSEFEQGIPIPPPNRTGVSKYQLPKMKVGDSVLLEHITQQNAGSIAAWAARHMEPGAKFTTRKMGANVRVWRIK